MASPKSTSLLVSTGHNNHPFIFIGYKMVRLFELIIYGVNTCNLDKYGEVIFMKNKFCTNGLPATKNCI